MAHVAFLGLGAMGSRMAANLLKAGHSLSVWNRTPAAAQPLVAAGASQASSPREAAQGAAFVFAMVRDDEASREVWLDPTTGAFAGLAPGALAIDSSTLSLDGVRALGDEASSRAIAFLEAPVSGTLPQAETGTLIYLVGGEVPHFQQAEPVLKAMGALVHHVGPLGNGALAKLCTNTLLATQATLVAELVGTLNRVGADAARILEVVATTSVWSPIAGRHAGAMLAGNFTPMFPVDLIEKDLRYTLAAAGSPEKAPTIAASRQVFRAAMEQGLGSLNHTAVVKLFDA
nr:NAD(P)-dependent oxidoreductase [uncultured Holophaga sp.]